MQDILSLARPAVTSVIVSIVLTYSVIVTGFWPAQGHQGLTVCPCEATAGTDTAVSGEIRKWPHQLLVISRSYISIFLFPGLWTRDLWQVFNICFETPGEFPQRFWMHCVSVWIAHDLFNYGFNISTSPAAWVGNHDCSLQCPHP